MTTFVLTLPGKCCILIEIRDCVRHKRRAVKESDACRETAGREQSVSAGERSMSNLSSMSRKSKKRQLKRGMLSSDSPPPKPTFREEEAMQALRQSQKKSRRRRRKIAAAALIAAVVFAGGAFYYQRTYEYTSFETAWEVSMQEGSLSEYESFGSNVLKVTRDGASYVDASGKLVWTESYEMREPAVSVQGEYAVVADRQGNSVYVFHTSGKQGEATTVLPISKAVVSATGIVAAVLEDSTASYIAFFNKDGTALDVTIKTIMSGNGYPLDIALSRDGTQLIGSFVYLQGGEMKSRVVFYDFSEVGKNIPNRFVGGFDEPFAGTMVPRVVYMSEPYSCAFSGNGITFFSSRNLASPEMIGQAEFEEEIESICYSEDYAALILRNTGGEFSNRLEVYKKDGTHVMSTNFNYEYTYADIDDNLIILYNDDSCKIFNMAGVQKLYAVFDFPVSCIRKGRFPNTLVVTGPQQMREIRLH